MVAILNNRQFIFASFFCLGFILLGWYVVCSVKKISLQSTAIDFKFDPDLGLAINGFLGQVVSQDGGVLFKELKTRFPMVGLLKVQRIGLNKNYVQVFATDLMFRLGNKLVLDKNNNVFLANNFTDAALRDLPDIYQHVVAENEIDIELAQKDFLQNLPNFIIQAYDVHWYGPNQVVLIDKQNNKRQIIVRYEQVISSQIIKTCHNLFEEYQMHVNKKCLGTIKADLRFDGQIVMAC